MWMITSPPICPVIFLKGNLLCSLNGNCAYEDVKKNGDHPYEDLAKYGYLYTITGCTNL